MIANARALFCSQPIRRAGTVPKGARAGAYVVVCPHISLKTTTTSHTMHPPCICTPLMHRLSDVEIMYDMIRLTDHELGTEGTDASSLHKLSECYLLYVDEMCLESMKKQNEKLLSYEKSNSERLSHDPDYVNAVVACSDDLHLLVANAFPSVGNVRGHKLFQTQTDVGLERYINWSYGSQGDIIIVTERTGRPRMVSGAKSTEQSSQMRKQKRKEQRRTHMAELLAHYLHMVLGGNIRDTAGKLVSNLSMAKINEHANKVLEIFPPLNNKDMFADCYQALLMKRLLKRGFNEDNERQVHQRLPIA